MITTLPAQENLLTAQMPERFINESQAVDVSLLRLYFVSADLPVKPNPPEGAQSCTSLWRGYVGTWRLNVSGTLDLIQFEFPLFDKIESVVQSFTPRQAVGDFKLTFRPFFDGPNTEVPFLNGLVVEDKSKWDIEDQTILALPYKVLDGTGLVARTFGGTAFIPKSLLLDQACNLETMIDQQIHCVLHERDDDRGTLILRQIESAERG